MHSILSAGESPVILEAPHGETLTEWVGSARQGEGVRHSVAQAVILPGRTSIRHFHPEVEESYVILEGKGRMLLGEESRDVGAGDAILIQPGVSHKIINTGERPLRLVVTCVPAWSPDCSVFQESWDPEQQQLVPVENENS